MNLMLEVISKIQVVLSASPMYRGEGYLYSIKGFDKLNLTCVLFLRWLSNQFSKTKTPKEEGI